MFEKNKKIIFIFVLLFICCFCFINIVNANTGISLIDCSIMDTDFGNKLKLYFKIIKIAVPILTVVLIGKDMITAVASGSTDNMKKAQGNSIKRLIVGLIIFLLPIALEAILKLVNYSGTCGVK